MGAFHDVVLGLSPVRVAGEAAFLPEGAEVLAPGQQFVDVGLVSGVKNDAVTGRVEDAVHGQREFHDAGRDNHWLLTLSALLAAKDRELAQIQFGAGQSRMDLFDGATLNGWPPTRMIRSLQAGSDRTDSIRLATDPT